MRIRTLALMFLVGFVVACGGDAPSGDDDDPTPDADVPSECGPAVVTPEILATGVRNTFVRGPDALYFTDDGTTLVRLPLDGGERTTVASALPALGAPKASDATAVYWVGYENGLGEPGTLVKVPLSGPPETLVSMEFTSNNNQVFAQDGRAYWGQGNDIFSIGSSESSPTVLATAATAVRRLTADQDGEYLYFADDMSIYRLPVSGGGIMEVVSDARDSQGGAETIVATADRVYWTGRYSLNTCPIGCATREVVDESSAEFDAVRLGPNGLYYLKGDAIMYVDGQGGLVTTLLAEASEIIAFAVDDCRLYWLLFEPDELKAMSVVE